MKKKKGREKKKATNGEQQRLKGVLGCKTSNSQTKKKGEVSNGVGQSRRVYWRLITRCNSTNGKRGKTTGKGKKEPLTKRERVFYFFFLMKILYISR